MSRLPRHQVLFNGCFAHVFSRSFEGKSVFRTPSDFETFQGLLGSEKKRFGFGIHHYCLMNTHFHLALSIPNLEDFSLGMANVKREYTKYFNRTYRRTGPLWRERFRSMLIEDEKYLYACGLYIEHNPVKAGMVSESEDWPYSSSRHYHLANPDSLIDPYEAIPPTTINLSDETFFTQGHVIGSELFKLQIKEGAFQDEPVPA
jgi:putative transposase